MIHPAIPTVFLGVRYRSRLEARWAAFFARIGLRFEYEPAEQNYWEPDFVLVGPKADALVEVKPVTRFDSTAHEAATKALHGVRGTIRSETTLLLLGCLGPHDACWRIFGEDGEDDCERLRWLVGEGSADVCGNFNMGFLTGREVNADEASPLCFLSEVEEQFGDKLGFHPWAEAANEVQWRSPRR